MTYYDVLHTCALFFILGFMTSIVYLLICRMRTLKKKRQKSFKQPAKFVPELDLELEQVQPSVDDSSALNKDFKFM